MLPNFEYVKARSLQDVMDHQVSEGSRILAGGTDLLGCLRERIFNVKKIVSISRLGDYRGIVETPEGGIRIGALTTLTDVSEHPLIKDRYPGLALAASEVASPQLRNQGTIGGNLCQKPRCWYYRGEFHCLRKGGDTCYALGGENQYHSIFGSSGTCCYTHPSDTAPMLAALEASVRIAGPQGNRTVPVDKFHVLPDDDVEKETVLEQSEMITEVFVPPHASGLRTSYRKIRARRSWDFALAGAALAMAFKDGRVERARIVLSGAAPVPWRSKETEQAVIGKKLDQTTIAAAADEAVKRAEPLQYNGYKIPLFRAMLLEELTAMSKGTAGEKEKN